MSIPSPPLPLAALLTPPPCRRLVGALTISAATFALGHSLGIFDEPTAAHDDSPRTSEWTKVGPQAAQQGADDEASTRILFFLPTGFPQPQKRVLYDDSDPEVQETDALTADRARLAVIRGMSLAPLHSRRHVD